MIDLQAEEPTIFWTYEDFSLYKPNGYGDEVWIADRLLGAAIHNTSISLDAPEEWPDYVNVTLKFVPDSSGYWIWTRRETVYEAVRTDTRTHTILTGVWTESGERGAFVAVLPRRNVERVE